MSHSTTARSGTRSLSTDTRRKLRRSNIEHEGPSTLLGPSLIFACTYVCGAVSYDPVRAKWLCQPELEAAIAREGDGLPQAPTSPAEDRSATSI